MKTKTPNRACGSGRALQSCRGGTQLQNKPHFVAEELLQRREAENQPF